MRRLDPEVDLWPSGTGNWEVGVGERGVDGETERENRQGKDEGRREKKRG